MLHVLLFALPHVVCLANSSVLWRCCRLHVRLPVTCSHCHLPCSMSYISLRACAPRAKSCSLRFKGRFVGRYGCQSQSGLHRTQKFTPSQAFTEPYGSAWLLCGHPPGAQSWLCSHVYFSPGHWLASKFRLYWTEHEAVCRKDFDILKSYDI